MASKMKSVMRKPFRRAGSTSNNEAFAVDAPVPVLSPGTHSSDPNENGGMEATSRSEQKLADMGYKQEFKREMTLLGVVGLSLTSIGILTGMSSAFQTGLFSGGPLGLFWGWMICSFFMELIALALAEICSFYPTSGGLYFWTCKLGPKYPFLGYLTGNLYVWALVLTGTSGNLSTALYLASMVEVGTGKTLTRVEIAAIAWAICILSGMVNTIGIKAISGISKFNVWWTLGGTVTLVIALLVKAPEHNSAAFVFTDFENYTGYGSRGFVVLLAFLQAVYTLEGCETGAQVSEETKNAEWAAPVAIAASVAGSWFVGVIYLLALLFSVVSIDSVHSTSYAIPIAQLYYDIMGKKLTLMCLFIIMFAQWAAALTAWTASSRLFYALARDNAFGPRNTFLHLTKSSKSPLAGIWLSVLVGIIICTAYIGSAIAFSAILSSAAIAVMLSYLMPMLIRVIWPDCLPEKGPFHLGRFSYPCNLLGSLFTVFVCVLFVLPTSKDVNAQNMNCSIVAISGVFGLVALQWLFIGRSKFKGLVRTLEEEKQLQRDIDAGKLKNENDDLDSK